MSEQADNTQTTEAQGGQEQQSAPDFSALMGRMDELAQSVKSLTPQQQDPQFGGLSDSIYGQQGFEDGQQPDWNQQDGYEAGQYGDQFDGMDPQAQQRAAEQEVNRIIDARVQEALAPHLAQQQQRQAYEQAVRLEQKYPDLQKPEIVGPVMQEAQARAMRSGRPDLIQDPEFIELVYLAKQAQTNASQQTAADGGSEAHIEGEGAVPDAPEDDFAQRVVNAGPGGGQESSYKWF